MGELRQSASRRLEELALRAAQGARRLGRQGSTSLPFGTSAGVSYPEGLTFDLDTGDGRVLRVTSPRLQQEDRSLLITALWQLHPRICFLKSVRSAGAVFDLGAGGGSLPSSRTTYYPDRSDLTCFGIDLNSSAGASAYTDFVVGDFSRVALPKSWPAMAAIMAAHVIEHVDDAPVVIERCARMLAPGGQIYFEWPAPISTQLPPGGHFQAQGIPGVISNFFEDPTHRHSYALGEMTSMLERAGLVILAQGVINSPWLEDQLLAYARAFNDGECGMYGFWLKVRWCNYVIAERAR